ncbi:MAG: 3-oxoacyl-ACP synthase III [Puniceicoccales bacterium]|jgi:3-oxoacyl-[acyl-carrier-protein] synthase-3|nr:3-oxoacyl-ACP synthase III [Puniceicoccales bacterium]
MQASFSHVALRTLSHVLPPEIKTSAALEEELAETYRRFHLSAGRLELMSGIRERRLWPPGMLASQASGCAAQALFKGHPGLARDEIDLLIHAAVCRDRLEPATASYVHKLLSLSPQAQAFDLSNACLGVLNALWLAASQIESGQIRSALIVSGENSRPLLESTLRESRSLSLDRQQFKRLFANLSLGSGAVALLLSPCSAAPEAPRLVAASALADTEACRLCEGGVAADASWQMLTESEALLQAGIDLARRNWHNFLRLTRWEPSTIQHFLTHQVGQRHRTLLYGALGLEISKDFSTFPFLGNTGSSALPMTLSIAWEQGRFHPGDRVALLGIGSGLHSIILGLEFPQLP